MFICSCVKKRILLLLYYLIAMPLFPNSNKDVMPRDANVVLDETHFTKGTDASRQKHRMKDNVFVAM